jgi:hypothetical protein
MDWEFFELVKYFDAFLGPPHEVACTGGRLSFRLDGRPGAKWWKDWLAVRLSRSQQRHVS